MHSKNHSILYQNKSTALYLVKYTAVLYVSIEVMIQKQRSPSKYRRDGRRPVDVQLWKEARFWANEASPSWSCGSGWVHACQHYLWHLYQDRGQKDCLEWEEKRTNPVTIKSAHMLITLTIVTLFLPKHTGLYIYLHPHFFFLKLSPPCWPFYLGSIFVALLPHVCVFSKHFWRSVKVRMSS